MNLTEYAANAILDGTPIPATLHLQLHNSNPGPTGVLDVAAVTSRQSFTRTAASGGTCSNVGTLLWTSVPANEDIYHGSVWDANAAGNCWFVGALDTPPLTVATGNNIAIVPGALDISLDFWV